MGYYFKRDVWKDLMKWKKRPKHTLEVKGARQVGKTFILKKFCEENFKQFFYINMAEDTGKSFLKKIEFWSEKYSIEHGATCDIGELMELYAPQFKDSEDTVVLIDEIQESSRVYNLIRQFTRDLKVRFIITGSYLGKTLDRDFFTPVGDLTTLTIYPLSFSEFLDVFDNRKLQQECYSFLKADKQLEKMFMLYTQVGGYPSVIAEYLDTKDLHLCREEILSIVQQFTLESLRYFTDIEDVEIFDKLLSSIAVLCLKEKQGTNLNDLGIANYFIKSTGAANENSLGFIAENYVYTVIRNKFYPNGLSLYVAGGEPAFTIYTKTGGELDFILCSMDTGKKIGIEVKSGKNAANTGRVMLEDRKIDELYILKGRTGGGIDGNIVTVPLYLADQIQFDLGDSLDSMSFF